MTEHDLRGLLEDAVPEPVRSVSVPAVFQVARRRVHRRRSAAAGGVVAVGAIAAVTVPGLVGSSTPQHVTALPSGSSLPPAPTTAAPSSAARPSAAPSTLSPSLAAPQTEEGPVVNWDAPLTDGLTTDVGKLASAGHLNFPVFIPRFSVKPSRAEVTRPGTDAQAKRVVLHYDFGVSADFPNDGRVVVNESPTVLTGRELAAFGGSSPGLSTKTINVPGASAAVLLTANGEGRVLFVRSGTLVDIAGPALSPSVVAKLATQF